MEVHCCCKIPATLRPCELCKKGFKMIQTLISQSCAKTEFSFTPKEVLQHPFPTVTMFIGKGLSFFPQLPGTANWVCVCVCVKSFSNAILAAQRSCSALPHCKSSDTQNCLLLTVLICQAIYRKRWFQHLIHWKAQVGERSPSESLLHKAMSWRLLVSWHGSSGACLQTRDPIHSLHTTTSTPQSLCITHSADHCSIRKH